MNKLLLIALPTLFTLSVACNRHGGVIGGPGDPTSPETVQKTTLASAQIATGASMTLGDSVGLAYDNGELAAAIKDGHVAGLVDLGSSGDSPVAQALLAASAEDMSFSTHTAALADHDYMLRVLDRYSDLEVLAKVHVAAVTADRVTLTWSRMR